MMNIVNEELGFHYSQNKWKTFWHSFVVSKNKIAGQEVTQSVIWIREKDQKLWVNVKVRKYGRERAFMEEVKPFQPTKATLLLPTLF